MIPWAFERVIREDGFSAIASPVVMFSQVLPNESPRTPKREFVSTHDRNALSKEWVQCIAQRSMDPPFQNPLHGIVYVRRKHRRNQRDIEYGGILLNRLTPFLSSLLF